MNRALLGKWLWRIGERSNSLWKHLIMTKYGVRRNGWDVLGPTHRFFGLWRGINSIKVLFAAHIRYKIGFGEDVLFWLDDWVGDRPLAAEFTILFRCASNQLAEVKDYMERINDQIVWTPMVRRHLREDEER